MGNATSDLTMSNRNSELCKAIHEHDIGEIRRLLESGKCLIDGDASQDIPSPVVVCLDSGFKMDDVNDTRRCRILEILGYFGADLDVQNARGETAAMVVAMYGFLTCLRVLVDLGADLTITSLAGDTALTLAAMMGRKECVKYLTKNMPVSMLNHRKVNGKNALMMTTLTSDESYFDCLQHLIKAGADLDTEDREGYTALMLALSRQSHRAVTLLLERGARLNTVAHSGETPLTLSIESSNHKASLKLLHLGLDPVVSRRDKTCVHFTVTSGDKRVLRALVMSGFPPLDVTSRLSLWHTEYMHNYSPTLIPKSPLSLAIVDGHPDIARYLIANSFFTPFDVVRLCWQKNIRRQLQAGIQLGKEDMRQCLEILDFLSAKPQRLVTLSLTVVSSALSKDLVQDPPGTTAEDKSSWECRPSFREKVELLKIPPLMKRQLLHLTPSAGICVYSWNDIPLGRDGCFQVCSCSYCKCD